MEWLMIIGFIVVTILDSKKKSDQAKQQREQRQKTQGQTVYRSESQNRQPHPAETVSAERPVQKPKQQSGNPFEDFLKELENWADSLDSAEHPAKPSREVVVNKPSVNKPSRPKQMPAMAKKDQKPVSQNENKSSSALPTKTLMEMRPEREQREEHTKVSANVKPVTASVKPLKNAYENDEKCEHRIELNPNIQYSKQKQAEETKASVEVKTDAESLIQGIIWSEILGKPKAYQPNQPKFQRRAYPQNAKNSYAKE